jgi:hypothetical protein
MNHKALIDKLLKTLTTNLDKITMKRSFEDMSYPAPNTQQTPIQTPEHGQQNNNNQHQAPPPGGALVIGNQQTPPFSPGPLFGSPVGVGHFIFTPPAVTPVGTPNNIANQHAGMAALYAQNGIVPMRNQQQQAGGEVVVDSPNIDYINIVQVMQGYGSDMTPVSTPGSVVNGEDIIQVMQGDQGVQLFPNTPDNSDSDNESTTDESNTEEVTNNLFGADSDSEVETDVNPLHFPDLPELNQEPAQVAARVNDRNIRDPFTGQAFGSVFGPDSDSDVVFLDTDLPPRAPVQNIDLVERIAELTLNDHEGTTSESEDSNKGDQEMLGETNLKSTNYDSDEYDYDY